MVENEKIVPINLDEEMKTAYIDYSMSVIISRALPDVRDGLKPVHRRVLFGMDELGLGPTRPYKKSARVVGEVLGKYHPHGDSSVYDTMVRLAQDWSMRYPLVDGQGNFGSMDGDSPAAMRYTEVRFEKIAEEMLRDIDKETVDFALNFDDSLQEPTILPARIPNLLINGASGIAVGMATNILPHNLSEVTDALVHYLEKGDLSTDELLEYIKGPDLPTGGIIYGTTGIRDYFETGRGRIVVRGRAEIENHGNRESIIITEIPYQVNKASLVAKIAELVNEGKVVGISDTRDESDRKGLRVVVDVKKDAIASVVLSKLFKYTPLQSSYGVNSVALVKGRPMTLSMLDMIRHFIDFRIEVVIRRTRFELRKAEERAHILEGLMIALDHLDEVIALIRASKTVDEAHDGLMSSFGLSDIQAKAILEMRLQRLTGLERQKIKDEYDELMKTIAYLRQLLEDPQMQKDTVKQELLEIKEKYGDARRTEITHAEGDIAIEDLIADDAVAITISHLGYIKRTNLNEYKQQRRGGRGSQGSRTRDEDFIEHMFVASNHNYLLLFTELGRCFWLRVFEIPEASKGATGRVIQNILNLPANDKVKAYIPIQDLNDTDFLNSHYIMFCTRQGIIKKTLVEEFSRPRANGINALTVRDGDTLLEAKLTNGNQEIILANRKGRAIRFNESKVRAMGRSAAGVRGMALDDNDDGVINMISVDPEDNLVTIFVVSEEGYGKRTALEAYRVTNRGGKGVTTMKITDKTGPLISLKDVYDMDEIMITTRGGVMIRMPMESIRVMGRATQGVRVIRIDDGDHIADLAVVRENFGTAKNGQEEE